MELKKAIEILELHNSWRQGNNIPMQDVRDITMAIEKLISEVKNKPVLDDRILTRCENLTFRYIEAETFISDILILPWYKKLLLNKMVTKFLKSRTKKYKDMFK